MVILQFPRNARVRVVGVLLLHLSEVAGRALPPRGSREDAVEELEKRVAAYQFDVALLSCGSYGLPLGHYTVWKSKFYGSFAPVLTG